MYFEQFYLGCLAHASYMLASEGEAVIVDPQRDVEIYLEAGKKQNVKIRHIFETHLHADFVSGHKELAALTGATIYIGEAAGATFPHVAVTDGFELHAGRIRIDGLETPGHTPESICLVITDEEKSQNPWAVLTGDTLFIGDVGRPDLSKTHSPQELAGLLYDSLHNKLMTLPNGVLVYPAHGAGSLCGRNMRAERSSTIGTERLTNYALQIKSRDEFIKQMTSNLPARPDYFLEDAAINRAGATSLADLPKLKPIAAQELTAMLNDGAVALDVRPNEEFAARHVPGSINIALSGQFASWAGAVLGLSARVVVIADTPEQVEEARLRLARVGIENLARYLDGGPARWEHDGFPVQSLPQITVNELESRRRADDLRVLDVRRESEWESGHIHGAEWYPLDRFKASLPPLEYDKTIAVHCKGGYRSVIACSMLQRAGYKNVINVIGGFDAWQQANLPVERGAPAVVGA
ncbi:MAG: rhodanese-like domain-containing protein [Acidobacteriota bacterium]|nr:rhodanese-like domain-containing protein [Acidobacteriota bacterium]